MEASPIKLLRLLGDNETVFKIPVYQRKYEWNKEQLNQYFLDIDRILKSNYSREHFLGTVVYVQNELPELMKERLLIDGQQRVTTSLILLKALKDVIKEENNTSLVWKKIRDNYLINQYGSGDTRYKLMPVDTDRYAYEELMNNNESKSRIFENYKICMEYIKNSQYSPEDIFKALGYINIVYISLDRQENPQVIFESLNSTGLSLDQADLIRNFILMGLSYEEQTDLYKNYWKKIEDDLTNKVISAFVRDYLTMREGIVPKQNKVYDSFKTYYYSNKYDSREILEELLRYSAYYSKIINSATGITEVDRQLYYINSIKLTVSYPYILKLFDDFYYKELIDQDTLINVLELIVSYVYRRNICNIATNALNKIFASMSKEVDSRINKGMDYYESVVDFLMSRSGTGIFPRDEEFRKSFINIDIYNRSNKLSKIILHTIEHSIHKEVVDIDSLTVEHILPQTLNNEWNIELGKNSHEIHRLYKNTIGNLTLTNYNSEMGNKSFLEKKKTYKESNIKITRQLAELDNWTEEEILARADGLFEIIKTIWALPEDRYEDMAENRLMAHEEYSIKDNILVTGYSPKFLIIEGERHPVNTWREMLIKTCSYLYEYNDEFFLSLARNVRYKSLISLEEHSFNNFKEIDRSIYINVNFSAKDILSYVSLLFSDFDKDDQVYFEIK